MNAADQSWWKWSFGKELSEFTDAELRSVAQRAWNSNEGDTLRGCREEAKRRGVCVA